MISFIRIMNRIHITKNKIDNNPTKSRADVVASEHVRLGGGSLLEKLPLDSPVFLLHLHLLFLGHVEALRGEESREHVEGIQRLISRDFVASSLDGGVGVGVEGLPVPSSPPVHIPRLPLGGGGSVHLGEAGLRERERNRHYVHVTRIDEDGQAGLLGEEFVVIKHHVIARPLVVNLVSADFPVSSLGTERFLDVLAIEISGDEGATVGVGAVFGVVLGELQSSIASTEVLVQIIGVQRGLFFRGDGELLIDDTDLGDGVVVDGLALDRRNFLGVAVEGSPVGKVGV